MAAALRIGAPEVELLFVGSTHGPEGQLAQHDGIRFIGLPSRSLGGKLSLSNISAMFKLAMAVPRAIGLLRRERPDIVIGTGGYTSAAVMIAQSLRRGPGLVHEQNAVPGRTNLLLSRFVRKVCVTYEESAKYFPEGKVELTGLPIRAEFFQPRDKRQAREKLGLNPDMFTIFVCGGSQGARKVNSLVLGSAKALLADGVQILHQTGEKNYDDVKASAPAGLGSYRVVAYLEKPADAYWSADLVVCRSGASTLAELAAAGVPGILIPYPFAYANHQEANARAFGDSGAAIVMNENATTSEEFVRRVKGLRDDPEILRSMAAATTKLAVPDAAENVIRVAKRIVSRD